MKHFIAIAFVLLGFYGTAQKLEQRVDTNIIRFGEQITMQYGVSQLNGLPLQFLPFDMIDEDSLSIVSVTGPDTVNYGLMQTVKITAFDSGQFTFPSLKYVVGKDTISTQAFAYYCAPVEVDTSQNAIFGFKQAQQTKWTFKDSLSYYQSELIIFLVVLVVLFLGIWLFKKYWKKPDFKKEPEVVEPTISFEELIEQELNKIKQNKSWEKQDLKPYFSELNYVLRLFLDERFQIKALEDTSREILDQLKYSSITTEEKETIHQTLNLTDLVKYARENPTNAENLRHLQWLEAFIKKYIVNYDKEESNEQA